MSSSNLIVNYLVKNREKKIEGKNHLRLCYQKIKARRKEAWNIHRSIISQRRVKGTRILIRDSLRGGKFGRLETGFGPDQGVVHLLLAENSFDKSTRKRNSKVNIQKGLRGVLGALALSFKTSKRILIFE